MSVTRSIAWQVLVRRVRSRRGRSCRSRATPGPARCRARRRLLEDLLEHEVLVAGLLRRDRVPRDPRGLLARSTSPSKSENTRAVAGQDGDLLIAQEDDVACIREDGGDVRGHEELPVAQSDDHRRAVAHGDDLERVVDRQHRPARRGPCSRPIARRTAPSSPSASPFALDQVRDDLGVGLGDEGVALRPQLALQLEVVLDDAVVDDDDPAVCSHGADGRSPRWAVRASPSACGRARSRQTAARRRAPTRGCPACRRCGGW